MSELPVIKEREDGKWHVTFLGKEVLFTKNLVWVKSNLRKNRKVGKLGLTKFEVHNKAGKVVEVFDLFGVPVKIEKPKSEKPKPGVKKEIESKVVRVIGQPGSQLEGYNRVGFFQKKEGQVITLTFHSKRDGGISINYEFDAKTGIQNTNNPYHVWQIEDLEAV